MKKKVMYLLIFSAVLFTACATQPSEGEGDAQDGEESTKLTINSILSSSDPIYQSLEQFAQDITDASDGTLEVDILPNESVGNTTDVIEEISQGSPIIQESDPSHLADYVPDFSIFMHPYLITEPEQIETAIKSELGQRMSSELEDQGLKLVTLVYFGERHLLSDREVVTREDTEGMNIRNADTKMWNEISKVLGGNPTPLPFSEVYSALSQGVADAVESPLPLLYSSGAYEATSHISLTGHQLNANSFVMSKEVFDNLPPQAQKAIEEVGDDYHAKRIELVNDLEEEYRELLEEEGIKFNEVEKESFMEASKDLSEAFPEWSPDLYDEMLEAIN